MSESKRRAVLLDELRSGRFRCVYCGDQAFTVDHVPPRSAFQNGRPRGLEFPSCYRCNAATRDLDLIISWLSQIGGWDNPKRGDHLDQMTNRIKRNFPEFATSFRRSSPRHTISLSGIITSPKVVMLTVDEYFHAVTLQFGLKFALARHWSLTGHIATDNHRIVLLSIPNQDVFPDSMPDSLFSYFTDKLYLQQGGKTSRGIFSYAGGRDNTGEISGNLITVGNTFSCISFVIPPQYIDQIKHETHPITRVFSRKQILAQYPFGLSRLSRSQIFFRETSMDL